MHDLKSRVAVVIPAYNESCSIRTVALQVLQYIDHVIIVDDGSTDNTATHVEDLPITLLRNKINQGKATSLMHGFKQALELNVEAVLTLDADTQHNPADIPRFLHAKIQFPEHIIIGARTENQELAPKIRRRANKVADFFISWAAGHRIIDSQSGYRLYPISLVEKCLQKRHKANFVFESEVLIDAIRNGFLPAIVPIESLYPKEARKSHFRPLTDTSKIAGMLIWQITSRGMCLPSLYRALYKSKTKII